MLQAAKTDDQLAAVIGHEIAHVERAHAVERVNSEATTQLGVQVVGGVLQASGTGGGEQVAALLGAGAQYGLRSEEHTSELKSLMRISYAVFCLKKTKTQYKVDKNIMN